jgi:hypothetical protein
MLVEGYIFSVNLLQTAEYVKCTQYSYWFSPLMLTLCLCIFEIFKWAKLLWNQETWTTWNRTPHPLKVSEVGSLGVLNTPLPPEIFRGGVHGPHLCYHQGPTWGSFSTIFPARFRSPNYNNNSYTTEPSMKNWSVNYMYVPLENISLIWTSHHCRWRPVKLGLCTALRTFEQGRI